MTRGVEGPRGIPETEWSWHFLQGMVNRMSMSFLKYGAIATAYPKKVNAVESLLLRLKAYLGTEVFLEACSKVMAAPDIRHRRTTGNTEYLMDAANFAMIEFMHPALPDAFYEPTDSDGSTGRVRNEGTVDAERNTEDEKLRARLYSRQGD